MHKVIEVNRMTCPLRLPKLFNVVTQQAIGESEISDCRVLALRHRVPTALENGRGVPPQQTAAPALQGVQPWARIHN